MKIRMDTEVDAKAVLWLLRRMFVGYCVTIKDPATGGECCLVVRSIDLDDMWLAFSGEDPEPSPGQNPAREICVELNDKGEFTDTLDILYH